ncbi:hypothetical protein N8772_01975 [Rickettsiales bacterium]|nr:hypothetical protein [Rickettsiales bacterium]
MKNTIFFTTFLSLFFANIAIANIPQIDINNNAQKEVAINEAQEQVKTPTIANEQQGQIPQINVENTNPEPSQLNEQSNPTPTIEEASNNNQINDSNPMNPADINNIAIEENQEIQKEIIKNMFGAKTDPETTKKLDNIITKLDAVTAKIAKNNSAKPNQSSEELKLLILAIVGICFILFIITITTLLKLSKLNKLLIRASS